MSDDAHQSLRQRIITAATEATTTSGWSSVTMAALAESVGVSRQTVYNEVGSKPALAEAMVLAELERFLAEVQRAFDASPGDVVVAVRGAVRGVLEMAEHDGLLAAIVSGAHGADRGLLPLLTTDADPLIGLARSAVAERISLYPLNLSEQELHSATDTIVRAVLSHVMRPGGTPTEVADELAWVTARLLSP